MSYNRNDTSKGTNGDDTSDSKGVEKESIEETEKCENEIENHKQTEDGKELCEIKVVKDEPNNIKVLNINLDENVRSKRRKKWMMFIVGGQGGIPQQNVQQNPQQNFPQNPQQNPQQSPSQQNPQQIFQQNPQQNPPVNGLLSFFSGASPPEEDRPPPLAYKPETRNGFVRLVLCIVLIMLILTAGGVAFTRFNESASEFFIRVPQLLVYIPALTLIMTVNYAFMCSPCARVVPCNFIMLFLTVIGMTLIASVITVRFRTDVVIYAVISTAGTVIVCVLLACSKFDFTRCLLYVIVISAALCFIVMIVIIVKIVSGLWMKPLMIFILACGTLLEAVLLVMELQMVLGGRSVELSEHDYAIGAYMIYTSIVDIFLKLALLIDLGR